MHTGPDVWPSDEGRVTDEHHTKPSWLVRPLLAESGHLIK